MGRLIAASQEDPVEYLSFVQNELFPFLAEEQVRHPRRQEAIDFLRKTLNAQESASGLKKLQENIDAFYRRITQMHTYKGRELPNFYQALDLDPKTLAGKSEQDIQNEVNKAFRRRRQLFHPDSFGITNQQNDARVKKAGEISGILNSAADTLGDAVERKAYNQFLDKQSVWNSSSNPRESQAQRPRQETAGYGSHDSQEETAQQEEDTYEERVRRAEEQRRASEQGAEQRRQEAEDKAEQTRKAAEQKARMERFNNLLAWLRDARDLGNMKDYILKLMDLGIPIRVNRQDMATNQVREEDLSLEDLLASIQKAEKMVDGINWAQIQEELAKITNLFDLRDRVTKLIAEKYRYKKQDIINAYTSRHGAELKKFTRQMGTLDEALEVLKYFASQQEQLLTQKSNGEIAYLDPVNIVHEVVRIRNTSDNPPAFYEEIRSATSLGDLDIKLVRAVRDKWDDKTRRAHPVPEDLKERFGKRGILFR